MLPNKLLNDDLLSHPFPESLILQRAEFVSFTFNVDELTIFSFIDGFVANIDIVSLEFTSFVLTSNVDGGTIDRVEIDDDDVTTFRGTVCCDDVDIVSVTVNCCVSNMT